MIYAIVVAASVASLAGVGYLLIAGMAKGGEAYGAAALGIGSVVVGWVALQTVFTLRYARVYYSGASGGIDFNQPEAPAYVDFAKWAQGEGTGSEVVRKLMHLSAKGAGGMSVPRMALEYFVSKYITPKYPNVGIDSQFQLPNKIDMATVGYHKVTVTQK